MDKITNDNMVIGMCIVWIVEVAFSFFIPKPTQTFKQPEGHLSSNTAEQKDKLTEIDHQPGQLSSEEEIIKELEHLNNLQERLKNQARNFELNYLEEMPSLLTKECLKRLFSLTLDMIDADAVEEIYQQNRIARRTVFQELLNKDHIEESKHTCPHLSSSPEPLQSQSPAQSLTPITHLITTITPESEDSIVNNLPHYTDTLTKRETYYRFICTFEEQIQYLIESSQKDFLIFLSLDYFTITTSLQHHIEIDEDFDLWMKSWAHEIKEQIKSKLIKYDQPVLPDEVATIVRYEIEMLRKYADKLTEIVIELRLETEEEKEGIEQFVEAFLEDLVALRFDIEVEQLNLGEEEASEELYGQILQLETLRKQVVSNIIERIQANETDQNEHENYF